MKYGIRTAVALVAFIACIVACGGKKKDLDAEKTSSDGTTSATAAYDSAKK
jgi:hypothetical protein